VEDLGRECGERMFADVSCADSLGFGGWVRVREPEVYFWGWLLNRQTGVGGSAWILLQ